MARESRRNVAEHSVMSSTAKAGARFALPRGRDGLRSQRQRPGPRGVGGGLLALLAAAGFGGGVVQTLLYVLEVVPLRFEDAPEVHQHAALDLGGGGGAAARHLRPLLHVGELGDEHLALLGDFDQPDRLRAGARRRGRREEVERAGGEGGGGSLVGDVQPW